MHDIDKKHYLIMVWAGFGPGRLREKKAGGPNLEGSADSGGVKRTLQVRGAMSLKSKYFLLTHIYYQGPPESLLQTHKTLYPDSILTPKFSNHSQCYWNTLMRSPDLTKQ